MKLDLHAVIGTVIAGVLFRLVGLAILVTRVAVVITTPTVSALSA